MKKEEIIDILRKYKNERANYYGIMTIGIFGSF
jgi:predicted nucleotidyltransferase